MPGEKKEYRHLWYKGKVRVNQEANGFLASRSPFRVIMTWCLGGNCFRRHHLALEEGVMITRNLWVMTDLEERERA
jgi:hypothetical protein